jgi:hypothetical protein
MTVFTRFAIYYAPRPGVFAKATASLLGWDPTTGQTVDHADLPDLPADLANLTSEPRKYGLHGTLRAPFRPAPGVDLRVVQAAVRTLARSLAPVVCDGLRLVNLHGFLALVPTASPALQDLAATIVRDTNPLRAPLTVAEIARRKPDTLTDRQRQLLDEWGYPHVMDAFHFHLTLTNRLPATRVDSVAQALTRFLDPVLPTPFVIDDLCLFAEDAAGKFHLLDRVPLTG